jgi:hypothetical protein
VKRHPIPLFGGALIACASLDEFNAAVRRFTKQLRLVEADPVDWSNGDGATDEFVINEEVVVVSYAGGHACHEATHCAQAIALHIGLDPLKEQEAFAYLTQWCFDRITGVAA